MIIDLFRFKIVGWEAVHNESAHHAGPVIERAVLAGGLVCRPLVLHAGNGSPFRGATLLEKLHALNITPSHSRPWGSKDNTFAGALFRP